MDQILARSSRQCHLMMTRYKKAISADVTSAMKTGFFVLFCFVFFFNVIQFIRVELSKLKLET
jgi:hypothetical protein